MTEPPTTLQYLITHNDATVQVRWLHPFTKAQYGYQRDLQQEFEDIPGVEHVSMNKYAATLFIAGHVTTPHAVALAARDVFSDDNITFHHRMHFPGCRVEVDVLRTVEL